MFLSKAHPLKLRSIFFFFLTPYLGLFYSSFSQADEFLDPVVVTASRIEQPLSEVLPSVTVITKEEIQRSQARSIIDLLQGEPGIEVGSNGGLGSVSSYFLRGQSSRSVAIFVDGVRVQPDGIGSLSNTSLPTPQAIDRVEILRGNSSSLYGEAAIGGVINIFTNAGLNGSPKAFGTVTYGSNKTFDTSVGESGRVNDTKFNITVNGTNSAGFMPIDHSIYQTSVTNTGMNKGEGINFGISQILNQNVEVGFREKFQDNTNLYNGINVQKYDTAVLMRTISNDTTVFAKAVVSDAWLSSIDLTKSKLDYQFTPFVPLTYDTNADTNSLNWTNTYELSKYQKASFGASLSNLSFNDGLGDLMYRKSYGFFVGDTLKWNRFDFQINARRDNIKANQPDAVIQSITPNTTSSNFGATTGLFGVGYHLTENLRLTSAVSSGFRAPAIQEFFNPYGGFNPNLTPELHHTVESGIEFKNSYTNTRLVYFNTNTKNAITPDPNSPYANINIPTVTNHGWEFSERGSWNGYRLIASFTSQNPNDQSNGQDPILRRAKQFGSIDLAKSIDVYDFGGKILSSSSRYDYDQLGNITTLSPYHIWSFYTGYKLTEEVSFRLRIENALNEKYQLAYGYNTPGRSAWLTMYYQQR